MTDAAQTGREAAGIRILNQRLPKKRAIAQGLITNERDEILLCELTYKSHWDLPGGVVDPAESPATGLAREVREELGLTTTPRDLLAVNWLPPYRGWDDAVLFLFDLGVLESTQIHAFTLLKREIKAVHWCPRSELADRVAPYVATLLKGLRRGEPTAYLENSERVTFHDR